MPDKAQTIPIKVNTIAVPKIKQQSCKKVLRGVSFEYPPIYPIIRGSIAREQGDIDAIIPPRNEPISNKYHAALVGSAKICEILFIYLLLDIIF